MSKIKLPFFVILLITLWLSLSSCANHFIAQQMVSAPNDSLLGMTVNNQFELINAATDRLIVLNGFQTKQIHLPKSKINISYFDIPAGDYGYVFRTRPVRWEKGNIRYIHTHWQWYDRSCFTIQKPVTQKGVLLMLHGWTRDSRSLVSYGVAFAQMGYRVIIPDLRGHGRSGGKWLSFGALESDDMQQLLDHLQLDKVDVFGFSLGATTGLHLAAKDYRVNRVIAIAAMHSIEQTIPKFGARSRPWIAWLLRDEEQSIVQAGNAFTGLDLQQTSDTLSAANQISNPTLLVYGEIDQMSDARLNQSIYQALKGLKAIKGIRELRHTHLLQHQSELSKVVGTWMGMDYQNRELTEQACAVKTFQL